MQAVCLSRREISSDPVTWLQNRVKKKQGLKEIPSGLNFGGVIYIESLHYKVAVQCFGAVCFLSAGHLPGLSLGSFS